MTSSSTAFYATQTLTAAGTVEVDIHLSASGASSMAADGGLGSFSITATFDAGGVASVTGIGPVGWTNAVNPHATATTAKAGAFGLTGITTPDAVVEQLTFILPTGVSTLNASFATANYGSEVGNILVNAVSAIPVSPPCFAAGTCIATQRGPVPVEDIDVGDLILTLSGATRPVIWTGRRAVDCTSHPAPASVLPVRISAGAFGPGLPLRDLSLSPDHAIFAVGVLIPISELINATTIRQIAVRSVTYHHVELDCHDVILAEGLPVESFLENDNRADMQGSPVMTLHPMFKGSDGATPCHRMTRQGPEVQQTRLHLDAIARREELDSAHSESAWGPDADRRRLG